MWVKVLNKSACESCCSMASITKITDMDIGFLRFCRNTKENNAKDNKANIQSYYIARSAIGQDKANLVFCLATREGKMGLLPLGISRFVHAKAKFFRSVIFWA